MSETTTAAEALAQLAWGAAWGLVKGGDLDSRAEVGDAALLIRLDILDAAASAGIHIDLDENGIGEIYTREDLNGGSPHSRSSPEIVITTDDIAFLTSVLRDRRHDRAHGGSGIGLAIAKALVDAHHGRITATSDGAGTGATFTAELPSHATSLAGSRES